MLRFERAHIALYRRNAEAGLAVKAPADLVKIDVGRDGNRMAYVDETVRSPVLENGRMSRVVRVRDRDGAGREYLLVGRDDFLL